MFQVRPLSVHAVPVWKALRLASPLPLAWLDEWAGVQAFVLDEAMCPFNVVRPGQRPRSTLTPGLALKDGQPYLAFAVQGGDEGQAGVEAAVAQALLALFADQFADHHGAGAAVAGGAAFLGAGLVPVLAQVAEYREVRVEGALAA